MTPPAISNTSKDDHFTNILAEFSKSFGSPSPKHPNVRCVSKAALVKELLELRNRLAQTSVQRRSGQSLLESLVDSGLVHPIDLFIPDHGRSADKFFSIGLNGFTGELDPIELLPAMVPDGAICYFTAVHFHGLSTQIPSHHHIARVIDTSPRTREFPIDAPPRRPPDRAPAKKRDRLGQRQFLYHGIPYYITARLRKRVPGIQQRHYTNKTIFSVTTYEQTLLDTLERPISCGGSSVVFEAWEKASSDLDQDRLLHYLKAIGDHRLTRRVGYMLLEQLQCQPEVKLKNYLHRIRRQTSNAESVSIVSLLPGHDYAHTNPDWRLQVP